jgi:hypothetical protein
MDSSDTQVFFVMWKFFGTIVRIDITPPEWHRHKNEFYWLIDNYSKSEF